MLVLSRRVGEIIDLPEVNVSLKVLSIDGHTCRLGIQAPREITILRAEINIGRASGPIETTEEPVH